MADRETLLPEHLRAALLASDGEAELAPGRHVADEELARYLDGSVDADERASIEHHLGGCGRCAEDLAIAFHVESESLREAVRPPAAAPAARADRAASPPSTATRREPIRAHVPRRSGAGTWLKLAAGIVLVAGAVVAGRETGRFVSSHLEPIVVGRLGDWSGRLVSADRASLVLLRGPGIAVDDLEISDDPRFSSARFARIERAEVLADPGALLRGKLRGSVVLERPSLRLVRSHGGTWNVETLGGADPDSGSLDESDLERVRREGDLATAARGAGAEAPPVQIASADVRDGTLEIEDLGTTAQALRLHGVNLTYRGANGAAGTLDLSGKIGQGDDRVVLRGRIGPFDGATPPSYRLSEVELENVPVDRIPGAPAAVAGALSFAGHVDTAGHSLDTVVRSARGGGDLELAEGTIAGRNLAADVLARMDRALEGTPGAPAGLLVAARSRADLGSILAAPETAFERLGGSLDLEPETMRFEDLRIRTSLLAADADLSLDLGGSLTAAGSVRLAPELAAVVLAAAPPLAALRDSSGAVALPFRASGTWSELELTLDVERVAALLLPHPPRLFAALLPPAAGRAVEGRRTPPARFS